MTDDPVTDVVSDRLAEADAAVRAEAQGLDADAVLELARATFSALMVVSDDDWLRSYADDVAAGRPTTFRDTPLGS